MMTDLSVCRNKLLDYLIKDKEDLQRRLDEARSDRDEKATTYYSSQLHKVCQIIVAVQQGEFKPNGV